MLAAESASALQITYTQLAHSGTHYEYGYTLTNDSAVSIEEFSIYFDAGAYGNLQVLSSPAYWDPLVAQPEFVLDGFVDWLALGNVLAQGESLGGFNIAFDWVGSGSAPFAQQYFEVYDPLTFDVLASGETSFVQTDPVSVPEPSTIGLLLTGLLIAGIRSRKRAA